MPYISRFKKKLSDRSGFAHREIELMRDEGSLVSGDEYDVPPPSDIPLGGEGDISNGDMAADHDAYTEGNPYTVHYLTATGTIPNDFYSDKAGDGVRMRTIYISGSASNITLTSDPQVARSTHGDSIVLYCVGSTITLANTSGLSLYKSYPMDSGSLLNLIYSATDNLWHETSRSHVTKNYGEF